MKILILGYGQVGKVLASLLEKEETIESVVCGDISIKEEARRGKISLRRVDLTSKEELFKAMEEAKPYIVVNTTLPKFNLDIMECCLLNKVNYLDTASFWGVDPSPNAPSPYKIEQLEYNESFKQNGIVGLITAGVSPGLTNLLARTSTLDLEEVDYIKIRLIEETKADKAVFSWCKEWLIDEINSKPLVYASNKFKFVDEESQDEEVYDFPEPFGKKKVIHMAQDEVGTLPLYINVKNVDLKSYNDQVELIKDRLKAEKSGAKENSADIKTFEEARVGFVVEASGKKNGQNKIIKKFVAFPKQREINKMKIDATFITYPTALMIKLFIMAIQKIKSKGVFPPEALDLETMQRITDAVKKNGINIWRTEISS